MLFNGKYYNKPGHLGMTRQQLKEALEGGGMSDDFYLIHFSYDEALDKLVCDHTYDEIRAIWSDGQKIILANYDGNLYYLNIFISHTATFVSKPVITNIPDDNEIRIQYAKVIMTSNDITDENVDFTISVTFH